MPCVDKIEDADPEYYPVDEKGNDVGYGASTDHIDVFLFSDLRRTLSVQFC